MKIRSASIKNILSIENADVAFDDTGLLLFQGWNFDSGRANGAGKTAIFNAISFAIYNKLPRKVTATEILRRGCLIGSVEVIVDCGLELYKVVRSRPTGVVFSHWDGTKYVPLTLTQEAWEAKLRFNYDQFMTSMYCAQGSVKRFLTLNDAAKKEFFLQLLKLEEFTTGKELTDQKIKILEKDNETLESKRQAILSKIEAYSESLIDGTEATQQIADRTQLADQLTVLILTAQQVEKPDLSKYQQIDDSVASKKTEITRARTRHEMLHDQYRKIGTKIKPFGGASTCYACGTALDTSEALTAHTKEMDELAVERNSVKIQIDACDEILAKESKIEELCKQVKDRKKKESQAYDVAAAQIIDLQSKRSLVQEEVKNLVLKLQNNSELQSKIKVLQQASLTIVNTQALKTREIELLQTISAMFSPTGAQAYVLDSVIESFNDKVKDHIDLLWPNVTYELLSYKEAVKGNVSAKFSEHLTMDGKDISIGSLSGGEFRALSLCVDFALIDIVEQQFGISLSPIVLDEPFDGLDNAGREFIVELLQAVAQTRQIAVIDHAAELKSLFSKVINVEKRSGVTTVSVQA